MPPDITALSEVVCSECGRPIAWTASSNHIKLICSYCTESIAKVQEVLQVDLIKFIDCSGNINNKPRPEHRCKERKKSFRWWVNIQKFWLDN